MIAGCLLAIAGEFAERLRGGQEMIKKPNTSAGYIMLLAAKSASVRYGGELAYCVQDRFGC